MLRNYLLVGVRNLFKNKAFASINIIGYALGLTSCFLIFHFVLHELRYDQHHPYADRTYRVITEEQNGDQPLQKARVPAVLAPTLKKHFPEISEAIRLIGGSGTGRYLLQVEEKAFYETRLYLADSEVFRVFDIPLIQGNSETALFVQGIVLTQKMARKYFGEEDPMGKIIHIKAGLVTGDFTVTGIMANNVHPFHLTIDFLVFIYEYPGINKRGWFLNSSFTYIVLPDKYEAETFKKKIPDFVAQLPNNAPNNLILQPLTEIHLHSHLDDEAEPNGSIQYVYLFSAVASLILLIACINFINMSTTRSTLRGREVGMRKVLGASRRQIIAQFIGESTLLSVCALILAIVLTEVLSGELSSLFGQLLPMNLFGSWQMITLFTFIALFTGIGASIYTAIHLSKFQPVQVLKSRGVIGRSNLNLRRGLVIVQFAITIVLIVCSTIFYAQMHYVRTKPLGFNKDLVVVISDTHALREHFATFKQELAQYPSIVQVTSGTPPGDAPRDYWGRPGESMGSYIAYWVDHNYLETFDIELKSGRNFSPEHITDTRRALIVNEAFLQRFQNEGLPPPLRRKEIIGVVKDFHVLSLRDVIEPLVMRLETNSYEFIITRIRPESVSETLAFLKYTWERFVSDQPFDYAFLDENLNAFYLAEQRLGRILLSFSVLAIFIACLGLFGLTAFAAECRSREIGIRKVLGASIGRIVFLLSGDFLRLVLMANLLAWPLAYYIMKKWLEGFAYRISLDIELFLFGSIASLFIALTAVMHQALKAATANPAEALWHE